MKKLFYLFSIPAMMLTLSSCSKEKRMERMMYKSDGAWNITTMTYTEVSTDENNVSITVTATAENPGTFTFEKDGDGSYNFTVGGVTHSQSFGWSTTDETLSIARISQNIDFFTGDINQLVIAFSGEKTGKNQLILTGTETSQSTTDSGISQSVLTVEMTLNKN